MNTLDKLIEIEKALNMSVSYQSLNKWRKLTESAKLDVIQGVTLDELVAYLQKRDIVYNIK
jgi:hypothetical protein